MCNSLAVSTFIVCSHYLCLVSKHFHHPQRRPPCIIKESLSPLLSPRPLAATDLFLVSVDFPVLEISYRWNHTICDLFVSGVFHLAHPLFNVLITPCLNLVSSVQHYSYFPSILATPSSAHPENGQN